MWSRISSPFSSGGILPRNELIFHITPYAELRSDADTTVPFSGNNAKFVVDDGFTQELPGNRMVVMFHDKALVALEHLYQGSIGEIRFVGGINAISGGCGHPYAERAIGFEHTKRLGQSLSRMIQMFEDVRQKDPIE